MQGDALTAGHSGLAGLIVKSARKMAPKGQKGRGGAAEVEVEVPS